MLTGMQSKYGKIVSIVEVEGIKPEGEPSTRSWYDGYEIRTENNVFQLLIASEQLCCENWGYFSSDDDIASYIGKELVEISTTDKARNTKKLEEIDYDREEQGLSVQFVTFSFSDGSVLQFAVYNAQNGYYGHPILFTKDGKILISDEL